MLSMNAIEAPWLKGLKLDGQKIAVIGAYKGDTVAFMHEWHPHTQIYAYEPQIWAFQNLQERFATIEAINIYNYGLGLASNENSMLYEYGTDAASLLPLKGWRSRENVRILDASKAIQNIFHTIIMNIEGYEYQLIPYLLELGIQPAEWVIQFHFTDRLEADYRDLQTKLTALYHRQEIGKGWEYWHDLP